MTKRFYNPLRSRNGYLLSPWERVVKHVVLPLVETGAAAAGLVAAAVVAGSFAAVLPAVGIVAAITAVRYAMRVQAVNAGMFMKLRKIQKFDLNKAADCVALAGQVGESVKAPVTWVQNIRRAVKMSGLPKLPSVIVSDDFDVSTAAAMSLPDGTQFIIFSKKAVRELDKQTLGFIVAHEAAHLRFHDTRREAFNGVFSEVLQNIGILPLYFAAFSIGFGAGLAAVAASFPMVAIMQVVQAKRSRFIEKRCDRFSMVKTGTAKNAADYWITRHIEEVMLGGAQPDIVQKVRRSLAAHPSNDSRYQEASAFLEANNAYCKTLSTVFNKRGGRFVDAPVKKPRPAIVDILKLSVGRP